jgi:hypothetical protein
MSGGIPLHRGRHMKRQRNLTNMTGLNFGLPNLLGTRREGPRPSLHNIGVIVQTLPPTYSLSYNLYERLNKSHSSIFFLPE